MRLVIARMNHETNTFSPVPTPLEAFAPRWGKDALDAASGSTTAMGAFLAFAQRVDAKVITPVFATANPSGLVEDMAWQAMSDAIVEAVSEGCDAVLLDLHGAMVTRSHTDGEGELLSRVRAAAPTTPIGVALDLHTNLTRKMVENSDVLVGFKTYPHVDMVETGEHVARLIERMLEDNLRPARAWVHPPLLAHTLMMNTNTPGAMRSAIEAARQAEGQDGVLAATVFGGFPLADIPDAGMSVVVVAEDHAQAQAVATRLSAQLWAEREHFVYQETDLKGSIAHARNVGEASGSGPVLLLDHGDNCMSGGTCDTMDVLAEALAQGLDDIIAGPFCDPGAVNALIEAGVGTRVSLEVGNRLPPLAAIGAQKKPLHMSGIVRAISDGEYVVSGPTYTGMRCTMGKSAVLDTGTAKLLISERPHEPWDLGVYQSVGLQPASCRFLILKSRMYYRPVFAPLSKVIIDCASQGVTSSDYRLFNFERLPRPIYPIDPTTPWTPESEPS
ncbi:M81 family peptidase [Pseudomonas cavernicola]|uniref:Microcystinase C n=1 Tax=Pseudomonas cavernicola TaxID=2320866 RepID=A0A418X937_9PSED|nr:M81 family metallopeptidase [Pseudomonas cavernicola]RJG08996.1 M81 family peptidase [Pseudomonas cavernicola]